MSSFDQKYDFAREFADAKGKNTKNINRDFELRMQDELVKFAQIHKQGTPEYTQFQRSIVAFAQIYDAKKHDLSIAFEKLSSGSKDAVQSEIKRLKGDISVQADYRSPEWYRLDMRTARAINVKSSVLENLGDVKFDFQSLTPEKRAEMEKRPFKFADTNSWKETGYLLGEEGANSIKDIALFFGSIPGSVAMLGEYIRLRSDRNARIKNEATLALMLDEFPALALVDLASDWDKAGEMLKLIASKLATGNQGDVAFAIVNTLGILAGGAMVAGKLGSLAGQMSRVAQKGIQSTSQTLSKSGSRIARGAATIGTAGSMALGGAAYAGEAVAIAGSKIAKVAGAVDNIASGQVVLGSAARGAEVLVKGKLLEVPRRLKETGMTSEDYTKLIEKNSHLGEGARSLAAGNDLGIGTLSKEQVDALNKAHNTGTSGAGNWEIGELRAKYEALTTPPKEGGQPPFTHDQARTLLELGYAGKGVKSFLTNAIDWLRDVLAGLFGKKKNEPTTKITDTREMQHGAPLDPVNPSNVAQYKDGKAPKKQIGKTEKQEPVQPSQAAVSDLDLQITGLKNEIAAAERGDIRMTPEGLAYRKAQLENLMGTKSGDALASTAGKQENQSIEGLKSEKEVLTKEIQDKKSQLEALKNNGSLNPIASTEFGQAFVNSLTLNYKIELLPNGEHIVKVRGPNTAEWKIATEEHGIPKGDGYARQNYEERIAREVEKLKQDPNYLAHKLSDEIKDLQSKLDETDQLIAETPSRPAKSDEKLKTQSKAAEAHSFRGDVDAMMKMDDATFQKNFTEAQYRKPGEGRSFEKEMFEGVANVRKLSDADIIANAQNIINGNRDVLRTRHPNLGPSNLDQSDKARMIAENAALRNRLVAILGKADPALPGIVEKAIKSGDTKPLIEKLAEDKNKSLNLRRFWPLLLLPLLLLAFCNGDEKQPLPNNPPILPPGTDFDKLTPEQIAELCKQCANGPLSKIDATRKSADATNIVLDIKRREDISKRWTRTKDWQAVVKEFNQYKSTIQNYSPSTNAIAQALEKVIKNASVENVQLLQRCIAMEANDNKKGQDGILGPITTGNILKVINICKTPQKVDSTGNSPVARSNETDSASPLPDYGFPI